MSDQTKYPDETLRDYVKGRLPASEALAIETAAGADPALAAEIALVRGIVKSGDAVFCRAPPAEYGWAKLSRAIDAEAGKRSFVPRQFSRWQVAAVALVAIAVSSFAVGPLMPRAGEQGGFEVASKQSALAHSALATFVPTAQESAIREALRAVNADIVAGPSALGVYMLAFKDAEALTKGVEALRARTGVVESVQTN
jgi:anti-sigma factor RsiW